MRWTFEGRGGAKFSFVASYEVGKRQEGVNKVCYTGIWTRVVTLLDLSTVHAAVRLSSWQLALCSVPGVAIFT